VGQPQVGLTPVGGTAAGHFSAELALFNAIVHEIDTFCRRRNIQLILVLLPGRSYLEHQGSAAHRVQAYLGKRVSAYTASQSIPTIDLAGAMQRLYNRSPGDWFFKNEGHLNAEGHRVVAGLIKQSLPGQ